MQRFQSMQLPYFLANYKRQAFDGIVRIETESSQIPRKRVASFHQGWLTYVGDHLINAPDFAKLLGRKFKLKMMDSALHLAQKKVADEGAIHDYLALFVRLEILEWQQIESFMQTRILSMLEPLIPHSGTITLDSETSFNLYYSEQQPGFRWADLQPQYTKRQQQWAALAPIIPSVDAIPRAIQTQRVEPLAAKHINKWANGQRSLLDIATALGEDSLALAQFYYKWAKEGWLTCSEADAESAEAPETNSRKARPIVLSVDDSAVVQTLIKRAIHDRYDVLLANNAVDALNILNSHTVALALLDVTMPDIDGLDLCRTIRSIGKFHNLPVVMLTAKDGMFDKLKGQMAGATHYLTKPITREKLLEVLERYVPSAVQP